MQFSFEAIGTQWWIEIFETPTDTALEQVKVAVTGVCSEFNALYSRFREDSLVSRLNRERVLMHPSRECRDIFSLGQKLYMRTEKACNMLVGHILEARGYDKDYSFIPDLEHSAPKLCNPLTDLRISEDTISLSCGNVDLGGYGKGYLIDAIATLLKDHGFSFFLINGGGDMYATSNHGAAVEIFLEHPLDPLCMIASTTLRHQGFAASSPFKRQWRHAEETYTHIVGGDNSPLLASFVKATDATTADAFAKSCLLLPEETLITLSERESVAFARFDHTTDTLWYTSPFLSS